jgi:multiple sugar transport system substrate-binding protein
MNSSRWRATVLLLVVSLLLAACSIPGKPAAPAEKAKVVIFVGFGTGTDPDQVSAQEALAKKFNESHDNITVEFMIAPHDQATEKYLTMVAGGNAPQLVGPLGISTVAQFFDQWEDVTPYIEKDGYDLSDFYGPAVTLNKYPTLNAGLPLGLYPSFLFYNKDAFDAAGIPYPTHDFDDKSWDINALQTVATQLTVDANGNNATSPEFDAANIKQWGYGDTWTDFRGQMTMFGAPSTGRPASGDYKTAQVNSAEWKYGAKWLHTGVHKLHFMPDAAGQGAIDSASGDPFGGGHVAVWYSHTWYMSEGLNGLPFKFDIAPLFFNQKGERTARIHADLFTIPKTAKNKDAAWEVMKWLVAPEQIMDVCAVYGCLPARKSVEELFKTKLKERFPTIDHAVIFKSIDYLDDPNHESYVPEWSKVNDSLNNTLTTIYTDPAIDTDALLETANTDVQTIFDDYWAKNP